MDDALDLCSECQADVGAFLLDGRAVCAACLAITLRVPTTDPVKLRAALFERSEGPAVSGAGR